MQALIFELIHSTKKKEQKLSQLNKFVNKLFAKTVIKWQAQ